MPCRWCRRIFWPSEPSQHQATRLKKKKCHARLCRPRDCVETASGTITAPRHKSPLHKPYLFRRTRYQYPGITWPFGEWGQGRAGVSAAHWLAVGEAAPSQRGGRRHFQSHLAGGRPGAILKVAADCCETRVHAGGLSKKNGYLCDRGRRASATHGACMIYLWTGGAAVESTARNHRQHFCCFMAGSQPRRVSHQQSLRFCRIERTKKI